VCVIFVEYLASIFGDNIFSMESPLFSRSDRLIDRVGYWRRHDKGQNTERAGDVKKQRN